MFLRFVLTFSFMSLSNIFSIVLAGAWYHYLIHYPRLPHVTDFYPFFSNAEGRIGA